MPHQTNWKTQADFSDYFNSLPSEQKLQMANNNVAAAQRLLAMEYYTQDDFDSFVQWTNKAANNGDPVALVTKSQLYIKDDKLESAKESIEQALNKIKDLDDQDFVEFVKKIVEENKEEIQAKQAQQLFELGKEAYGQHDTQSAINHWQSAADLGDPAAAYNVAKLAYENDMMDAAIYYSELMLVTADHSANPEHYRGVAHYLLGSIEASKLTVSGQQLYNILTHFQKAIAYEDCAPYQSSKNSLLAMIPSAVGISELELDTTPLHFDNGIVKTAAETLAKPNMTAEQVEEFLKYPDPRKSKKQPVIILSKEQLGITPTTHTSTPQNQSENKNYQDSKLNGAATVGYFAEQNRIKNEKEAHPPSLQPSLQIKP